MGNSLMVREEILLKYDDSDLGNKRCREIEWGWDILPKKKAVAVRMRGAESKTEKFWFQGVTWFHREISSLLRVILGVCEHII